MKNPYMPFWVNDYRTSRSVRNMKPEEKGLYLDLIFELWADGELPDDELELANLLGLNVRLFRRIFKEIRHKFRIKDGVVTHSKVSKLLLEFNSKSKQNTDNAKEGWKKRKNKKGKNANASDPQCNTESESESETSIKKTNKKDPEKVQPENDKIRTVFDHYFTTFKKTKATKLTDSTKNIIKAALNRGHDVESLLTAITRMSLDDWIERPNYNSLPYAIATIKGIDNVAKWCAYVPPTKSPKNIPGKDKDYGTTTRKKL